MNKIGAIICELNPLHLGHKYLIDQTKSIGITHLIGIMSSNFVQRGEPSIISKQARTEIALSCGFDLVIEIPSIWSMSTAEIFASAGVKIANNLNCVDTLIFGSECGNLYLLDKISDFMISSLFSKTIKFYLKMGYTFAKACEMSVNKVLGEEYAKILKSPNNILAIEYIKALKSLNSPINPVTVTRNSFYNNNLSPQACKLCNSSYIRESILKNDNSWTKYVPFQSYKTIENEICHSLAPANINFIERAVLYKIRSMERTKILLIADISEGLENRILKSIANSTSIIDLIKKIKTKRYTESRIKRVIMSIFLDILKSDQKSDVPYIKVLGSNERGLEILKIAKESSKLPIISQYSHYNKLNINAKLIFKREEKIDNIYGLMLPQISPLGYSQRKKFILKKDDYNE